MIAKKKSKPKEESSKKERERITIYLDSDILDFFRTRAKESDSPKYQAQINNELRRAIESQKQANKNGLSSVEASMLENDIFVKILKEKMAKI